ncbi:hypothetical protein PIB30_056914 [Stylosanthes scabra]|uniref:Uncharacterized protein n=1 Tax=Stylosanthes scabra TaxID=79078 RepID=A0ABU6QJD2_9FABA|nr:hypothetical protein [Stylosanthes scabra]
MAIGKYVDKFEEPSKFSMFLKHHPDSQWKATQFELGLRPEIKEKVATLKIKDYNLLVNEARIAEKTFLEAGNPRPPAPSVVNLMIRGLVMLVRMCAFDVANLDTTLITATSQNL